MSQIAGKWLASEAKTSVLQSKFLAAHVGVLTFANSAASSDTVTTEVLAAANTDTPQTALTAKGIYVGTVSSAIDPKKVVIRQAGTDQGIQDDNGDEIYGVLTEATGVYTLSYYNADGTAYTFAGVDSLDFYFVEIFDLADVPAELALNRGVMGVIDADQATTLAGHLNGGASKHDATEIDYERADGSKKNIQATSDDIENAVTDLDDAIGALAASPTNYTPSDASIVADHLAGIDTALAGVGTTTFSDSDFAIQDNGDATKQLKFEVSGITTATTRTVTAADRNVNLDNIRETKAETLTLNATDISNKYKDLTFIPKLAAAIIVIPEGGPVQRITDDFTIITDGSDLKRLNWNGLGMDGILADGDKVQVIYSIDG